MIGGGFMAAPLPPGAGALLRRLHALGPARRPADFIIGPGEEPYLERWWIIPRNRAANVYLHRVRANDPDRALHDHPWFNASLILSGGYIEHTIRAGGIHVRRERRPGNWVFRSPWAAHRLEIIGRECWSLFITGPVQRQWGFHCPRGWRPWHEFVDPQNPGETGAGCD